MTKPAANLAGALRKKQDEEPKSGGVAETFRSGEEDQEPTKKATYMLPMSVHRMLQQRRMDTNQSMRDLVIRYIKEGYERDTQSG